MGVTPDESVLAERLRSPVYSRLVPPAKRFSGGGVQQFFDFLRFHAAQLTDREVAESLSDYLPPEELVGLAMAIRAELAKLKG